jgi:alkylation response protein AidB-like acyl-CoA dehydrogenase
MDFSLTEEQQMIKDTAQKFAEKEIIPNRDDWNENRCYPG